MKRSKIKWVAARGLYTIDRVEHVAVDLPYTGTDGRQYGRVPGTRIEAYAGDLLVLTVTLHGTHPATRANYREAMARKIQDLGGSWMGRSKASEDAKADARVARESDPAVTPSAAARLGGPDRVAAAVRTLETYGAAIRPDLFGAPAAALSPWRAFVPTPWPHTTRCGYCPFYQYRELQREAETAFANGTAGYYAIQAVPGSEWIDDPFAATCCGHWVSFRTFVQAVEALRSSVFEWYDLVFPRRRLVR